MKGGIFGIIETYYEIPITNHHNFTKKVSNSIVFSKDMYLIVYFKKMESKCYFYKIQGTYELLIAELPYKVHSIFIHLKIAITFDFEVQ